MGAITGTIDDAALARLARGDGAVALGAMRAAGACMTARHGLCDVPGGFDGDVRVHASSGGRAVAIARAEPPTRWVYFGAILRPRAEVVLGPRYEGERWHDRWKAGAGAARLLSHANGWLHAVQLDAGAAPIGVYLGLDGETDRANDRATVRAIVLDAEGLGGLRDDRDGREGLRAAQHALAALGAGPHAISSPYVFDDFVPNLAAGVPRLLEHSELSDEPWPIELESIGALPLPSRTIRASLATFQLDREHRDTWPAAGDRADVLAHRAEREGVQVWMVRVSGVKAVRWGDLTFEDSTLVSDGAGGDVEVDGDWPDDDLGFVSGVDGAPLLCVQGPDLSAAHGAFGVDGDGRLAVLIVVS